MSLFLRYLFPLEKFSRIPKWSLRFAEEVSSLEIQFLFSNLYDDILVVCFFMFCWPRTSMKSHLLFHPVSCSVSMYLAVRDISGLCLPHLIFSCAASVSPEAAAFLWTASRACFHFCPLPSLLHQAPSTLYFVWNCSARTDFWQNSHRPGWQPSSRGSKLTQGSEQ